MKLNLFLLLSFLVVQRVIGQHVQIKPLNDFDSQSISKFLVNDSGDLVAIRPENGAVFSIYDTTNFQIKAEISPSYFSHGDPIDRFFDLTPHLEGGYLVCGRIPLGSSLGTPVIYWFNDSAQTNASFKGVVSGNHQTGYYPVFKNVVMRSDSHIVALYQYTWISSVDDTTQKSILFELDKSLNLLAIDTIQTACNLEMSYNEENETLLFYGTKNLGHNQFNRCPFYLVLDAYTNAVEFERTFETNGEGDFLMQNGQQMVLGYSEADSSVKVLSYNLGVVTDSLIIRNDSSRFEITSAIQRSNNTFVFFLNEWYAVSPILHEQKNKIIIVSTGLDVLSETPIIDNLSSSIRANFNIDDDIYFTYSKNHNWVFQSTVLAVADVSNVTSVNSTKAQISRWKVYPNPVSNSLQINIPKEYANKPCNVHIYSVSGVLMRSENLTEKLDFSSLSIGLYILFVINENGVVFTTKISKQ